MGTFMIEYFIQELNSIPSPNFKHIAILLDRQGNQADKQGSAFVTQRINSLTPCLIAREFICTRTFELT